MLDLATAPVEVWADWLEEQGQDPREIRAWAMLGLPVFGACDDFDRHFDPLSIYDGHGDEREDTIKLIGRTYDLIDRGDGDWREELLTCDQTTGCGEVHDD